MPDTPPMTARRWLAGLIEHVASLAQLAGYILDHIGDGLDALAGHLDTDTEPDSGWLTIHDGDHVHVMPASDDIDHDQSDDCPCGPAMRCEMTGKGDQSIITHHRLAEETVGPEREAQ